MRSIIYAKDTELESIRQIDRVVVRIVRESFELDKGICEVCAPIPNRLLSLREGRALAIRRNDQCSVTTMVDRVRSGERHQFVAHQHQTADVGAP